MKAASLLPQDTPLLSVVIPVYNGGDSLGICLHALKRSTHPHFEVLIVDDGSTDDSVAIARRSGFHVLTCRENRGPGAVRNLGAEQARGEVIFFLDADILVQPDSLQRIGDRFAAEPGLDALFGSFVPESVPQNFFSRYKNLVHHHTHQNSSEEASTFCGGFGAIRKQVFLNIGGFDPEHRFLEDVELGLRLSSAGKRIQLYKQLQFAHCKHYSLAGLLRSDFYQRALPWTRLILTTGMARNDLNTKVSNVASVPVSYALLLSLLLLNRSALVAALCLLVLFFWLNRSFFLFVLRQCGSWFMLCTVAMQWFTYLCSGFAVLVAFVQHVTNPSQNTEDGTEAVQ